MACIDQDGGQQSASFKHYCRVCKKGFMCGRALGGHMRAHGIGDDSANMEDDDQASDWEEKMNDGGPGFKRMYQLRANPNRLKSVRVCENCGKEFFSWKSFLEHGKCSSDDAESLVSSPGSDDGDEDFGRKGPGWSKRKRSFRAKVGNFAGSSCSEDEDILLAKCLIDLANARVEAAEQEVESSAAAAAAAAVFLAPLAAASRPRVDNKAKGTMASSSSSSKGLFECKACKKVFTSHQALGGHRASHKKVKGCYAAKQDQIDNVDTLLGDDNDLTTTHDDYFFPPPSKTSSKSKDHECSICHRVFSTGQALGGHKRCHWITSSANSNSPETSAPPKFHFQEQKSSLQAAAALDLNLPAGDDMNGGIRRDPRNPFSFEVSTDIHLRPFTMDTSRDYRNHPPNNDDNNDYYNNDNNIIIDDEHQKIAAVSAHGGSKNLDDDDDEEEEEAADSNNKVELAKLSGLKEMNSINKQGNASPWLQVGIGSTSQLQ
ncbi:PREDICTED: zinc finger protein ZAT4-like [Ipomoea nil]|uniref:zinc finger protein ZAT4-like n=1 Tax=Ipomoea nil TaxID=35883 RepID=UPI0009017641|nr:PREDICTED: zinc finger protein ZAT4-like [Ipomoea nil]